VSDTGRASRFTGARAGCCFWSRTTTRPGMALPSRLGVDIW